MGLLDRTNEKVVQVKNDLSVLDALFDLTSECDDIWCHGYETLYSKFVDLYIYHPDQMGSVFRDYDAYNWPTHWGTLWPTGDMYLIINLGNDRKGFEIVDTKTYTRFSSFIKKSDMVGRNNVVEMDITCNLRRLELKYWCNDHSKVFRLDEKNRPLIQTLFDNAPEYVVRVNRRNHNRMMYDFPMWYSTLADNYPKNVYHTIGYLNGGI